MTGLSIAIQHTPPHPDRQQWMQVITKANLTRAELFEYIEVFYNARRKHSAQGYLSPGAFEKKHRRSITIAA